MPPKKSQGIPIEYISNRADRITAYTFENDPPEEVIPEKVIIGYLDIKDGYLYYIGFLPKYEGFYIETTLLKLALKLLPPFKIVCVEQSSAYFYSLSKVEEKAVVNCILQGLIPEDKCIFDNNADGILCREGIARGGALRKDSSLVQQAFEKLKTSGPASPEDEKNASNCYRAPELTADHKKENAPFVPPSRSLSSAGQ